MILFRVDGNEKTGLGHIMRCLSIALALREKSEKVCFVLADSKCQSIIEQRGFECFVLNTDYSDMESELSVFLGFIGEKTPHTIVIDSYYVTYDYLAEIKKSARTVYLDDTLAFAYPVDVLINYNIFSSQDKYDELYSEKDKPVFLLGTDYVPLRGEFSDCDFHNTRKYVKNILISTGGADTNHIALKLLEYLMDNSYEFKGYVFKLIVGSMNADIERIEELARKLPNVELKINVKDMKSLMLKSDLAVSAAGSTLYELCVCCVPTVTYVIADNQLPAAKAFANNGIMVNIGDLRNCENVGELTFNSVLELKNDYIKRKSMVKSAYERINKNGSKKIAELLKK